MQISCARRGKPQISVNDNGTQFTSMTILRWSQEVRDLLPPTLDHLGNKILTSSDERLVG